MKATQARVLIVDDRVSVRLTLRKVLLKFGCDFSEAECGADALELLASHDFDVIFLDLMLPDFSGIETLRKARERSITLGKVIILTGLPELTTQSEASELEVFRYLAKDPIDLQEIRKAFTDAISDSSTIVLPPRPEPKIDRTVHIPSPRLHDADDATVRRAPLPRLLVLDDNPRWLSTMQRALGKDFDLTLTTSPDEACKWARKENFDLLVLDMRLPGEFSGLDVLSRMRRAGPDLRAIILTEHPDLEGALESGRRGALHYVSKEKPRSLTQTIHRILSENAKPVRVFLSYDRRDIARVSRLYDRLLHRGFLPWMDVKSIIGGRKWEPEIQRAIERCDYFVACLSRNSLYKEGVIRKEIKQALERQEGLAEDSIFFIPARLEDCEDVEPFRDFFYVDLFKKDGFTELIRALSNNGKPCR